MGIPHAIEPGADQRGVGGKAVEDGLGDSLVVGMGREIAVLYRKEGSARLLFGERAGLEGGANGGFRPGCGNAVNSDQVGGSGLPGGFVGIFEALDGCIADDAGRGFAENFLRR